MENQVAIYAENIQFNNNLLKGKIHHHDGQGKCFSCFRFKGTSTWVAPS